MFTAGPKGEQPLIHDPSEVSDAEFLQYLDQKCGGSKPMGASLAADTVGRLMALAHDGVKFRVNGKAVLADPGRPSSPDSIPVPIPKPTSDSQPTIPRFKPKLKK